MAENPATWGHAELAVMAALEAHDEAEERGECGLSLVRRITDELRREGLLADETKITYASLANYATAIESLQPQDELVTWGGVARDIREWIKLEMD